MSSGVLLIGLLATEVMTGGPEGLFYGGGLRQLGKQALGIVVVAAYAFAMSFAMAKLIDRIIGFRVSPEDETAGVDFSQHAETAYAEGVHGHAAPGGPARSGHPKPGSAPPICPTDLAYATTHNARAMTNAVRPSVVSMTVQVFSVVFTSMPKNRLTSQKPESLTWESTVAPAAMAITSSVSWKLLRSASAAAALIRPAVVVNATVAEPCATRSNVAMMKACTINDIPRPDSESLSALRCRSTAARRRTCRRRR